MKASFWQMVSGGGKQEVAMKGIPVFIPQLFCDFFKKVTSEISCGKGKAEGSWLGPWALSTVGCFVCRAEILTGARVEAGE